MTLAPGRQAPPRPDPTAARGREPDLPFRPDINGLRALAVVAVLGFHFQLPQFGGGFIGVDIFFVISGYLMTGIILSRLDRGRFRIRGFYLDRARRIVPPLAVLIALSLVVGAFGLLPDEYVLLARQAASSALFVSNFLHWRETGYFDSGLDQKWLLHSWTLSLEWQFYLLYPLLLLLLLKFVRHAQLRLVLAAAACLSFAAMMALSRIAPAAGFYLLPPRAWEFLAGALVYLMPQFSGRNARLAQGAGLILLVGGIMLVDGEGWPNGWALVPVAGTMLVILASRTGSRITGNGLAAYLGRTSYSIYLWHWPIVVALRRSGHAGEWPWIATGIAAALLLGHLSWRFVERQAWQGARVPQANAQAGGWRSAAAYAVPLTVLALASLAIWRSHGVPQRFPAEVQATVRASIPRTLPGAEACYSTGDVPPELCRIGPGRGPVLATLLGDSHADAQLAGLVEAAPASGRVAFNAVAGCPPILDQTPVNPRSRCAAFNARFLAPFANPRQAPLVLVASWAAYEQDPAFGFRLLRTLCALAAAGPTYVVLPTPHFPYWVTRELQRRLIADPNAPDLAIARADHESRSLATVTLLRRAERRCGVRLLDPTPHLCRAGACQGSRDRRPLYRDNHHLTDEGGRLLAPMFRPVFEDKPGRLPQPVHRQGPAPPR